MSVVHRTRIAERESINLRGARRIIGRRSALLDRSLHAPDQFAQRVIIVRRLRRRNGRRHEPQPMSRLFVLFTLRLIAVIVRHRSS